MRRHLVWLATAFALAPRGRGGGTVELDLRPSYYSHSQETGQRVAQYQPEEPAFAPCDSTYQQSGFRYFHSGIQVGNSEDHVHVVQTWGAGANIRPYGEWGIPFRPGATPYGPWGNPQGPWTQPWGAGQSRLPWGGGQGPSGPGQFPSGGWQNPVGPGPNGPWSGGPQPQGQPWNQGPAAPVPGPAAQPAAVPPPPMPPAS